MFTECYEGDCPLHAKTEPTGLCDIGNKNVKALCEDRRKLKDRIIALEEKLASCPSRNIVNKSNETDELEEVDNLIYFHCFHCNCDISYSPKHVSVMYEHYERNGMTWWECPVCGIRSYFTEVYSKSGGKLE